MISNTAWSARSLLVAVALPFMLAAPAAATAVKLDGPIEFTLEDGDTFDLQATGTVYLLGDGIAATGWITLDTFLSGTTQFGGEGLQWTVLDWPNSGPIFVDGDVLIREIKPFQSFTVEAPELHLVSGSGSVTLSAGGIDLRDGFIVPGGPSGSPPCPTEPGV